jgi:hypothetical protein
MTYLLETKGTDPRTVVLGLLASAETYSVTLIEVILAIVSGHTEDVVLDGLAVQYAELRRSKLSGTDPDDMGIAEDMAAHRARELAGRLRPWRNTVMPVLRGYVHEGLINIVPQPAFDGSFRVIAGPNYQAVAAAD